MEVGRRNTFQYVFKSLDTSYLREMEGFIEDSASFERKYGLVLTLMKTEIDDNLLSVLLQFYDPLYHCFTFSDYQLLPTLEEYCCLIGLTIEASNPFPTLAPDPKEAVIAVATGLKIAEVKANLSLKGGIFGLSSHFLLEKAFLFAQMKKKESFEALFALVLYGLILFPSFDGFVDMNAIKIFIAKNPVPTLLADTYHSVHTRNARKGGVITCCAPMLYRWYSQYLPRAASFWELDRGLWWSQKIMSLTHSDIMWFDKIYENCLLINSCGEFANVPLLGTKGGINYNPILARRQFGYPLKDQPPNIQVESFYFKHGENASLTLRIVNAWKHICRVGKRNLGRHNCVSMEFYLQWVRNRAFQLKMPYYHEAPVTFEKPTFIFSNNKEMEETALVQARRELRAWRNKFEVMDFENDELRKQLAERDVECSSYRKGKSKRETLSLLPSTPVKNQHLSAPPSSSRGKSAMQEPTPEKAPREEQLQQLYLSLFGGSP